MHVLYDIVNRGKMHTPVGILPHIRGKMPIFSVIIFLQIQKKSNYLGHSNSVIAIRFSTTISLYHKTLYFGD